MADIVLSVAELLELVLALNANRMPGRDLNPFKDQFKRAAVLAGSLADAQATVRVGNLAFSPFDCDLPELVIWGNLRNIERRGAKAASGGLSLILGTAGGGGSWTTSDLLVDSTTQLQYAPAVGGTVGAAPASESVALVAQTAGSQGVLPVERVLQWLVTPAGIEDEVEVQVQVGDGITTGIDEEGEDSFRTRVVAAWQTNKRGGSPEDYLRWIIDADSSNKTGYMWKGRNGRGTIDIAALKAGEGAARLLDAGERTALAAFVTATNPHPEQLRELEVFAESAPDIEVALNPKPGVAFSRDWDDSVGFTVSSYVGGTRTLTLSGTRPASLQPGSLLVVTDTPGKPMEVESLDGTDGVVLVEDFGFTITAAENVYAGSGLTLSVWQAIKDFISALGPRRGVKAAALITQEWESTLDLSRLFGVVQNVVGVLDHTQNLPASSPEPTELAFPDDAGVNLLVPGNVIVRYS